MNEGLTLARVKAARNGRLSHVSPEASRSARLGHSGIWACIHGLKRMVFYRPAIHAIRSSCAAPYVIVDGDLAVAIIRPEEVVRIGLRKGQTIGRNSVHAVLAF